MVVKLVVFKSGLILIGNVIDVCIGIIAIKEPLAVFAQPDSNGKGNIIGFTPYLDYSEEFKTGIEFKEEDILTINTPVNEMNSQYSKIFGSGIEIVSALRKV